MGLTDELGIALCSRHPGPRRSLCGPHPRQSPDQLTETFGWPTPKTAADCPLGHFSLDDDLADAMGDLGFFVKLFGQSKGQLETHPELRQRRSGRTRILNPAGSSRNHREGVGHFRDFGEGPDNAEYAKQG